MKLQTLYKSALVLFASSFLSCTDLDDSPIPVDNGVLIKKITETLSFGTESQISVAEYIYQGSVLTRISHDNAYQEFEYLGNKINTRKSYLQGELVATHTFIYEGDQLMQINSDQSSGDRVLFMYNVNGLAAMDHQLFNGSDYQTYQRENYVYAAGGNIGQRSRIYFGTPTTTTRSEYTYDTGNSPMRDMNPYLKLSQEYEGFLPLNQNNPLVQSAFTPSDATTGESYTYEYVYNDLQFPTEIRRKAANGTVISLTEIEYQ
ncbi:MAG TPA: hypothetical protein VF581_02315 [Flavobacterium sp.]|jgi:hypothetical protein